MKVPILILLLSLPIIGYAQDAVKERTPELDLYGGLLYSGDDMKQLKKTTDSLHLRYLECVPNPVYHSWPQTQAKFVRLQFKKEKAALIEAQLKQNVSLQQLLAAFPDITVEDSAHVVLAYQTEYDKIEKKDITTLYHGNGNGFSGTDLSGPLMSGSWVYNKEDEEEYCDMEAWLLDKPFSTLQLPQEYAKMVQYVDCMIDTSTQLMLYKGESSKQKNKPYQALIQLVHQQRNKQIDSTSYPYLDDEDLTYIYNELPKNKKIRKLLDDAVKDALEKGNGSETLEALARDAYSKDTILLLKRSRLVVGQCSRDDSPRRHARDIAVLASQTHQWPVFIRAHLNIMNDYFNRNSDGSYAEPGRKTYLRELELLDIPAQQLLLGTILRADHLSSSHYFGDLSRIGRAFTESAQAADFEAKVKSFMKDEELDPINRCLYFMVYASYCYRLPDVSIAREKITALKAEAAAYPEYIRVAINGMRER